MAKIELKPLAPEEAVKFFRAKGYAVGFNWRDVWQEEHAAAFTVAKAMRVDILEDIRAAVDAGIARGITFTQFRDNLAPILQAKGWWGRQKMTDPKTGDIVNAQLGSHRRLRTIFDTNMRTSYAAGRWDRIERVKKARPFLRYVSVLDDRTRPEHRAWHGTVLPVDHPFWRTHNPPNGWNCRCTVQQLSQRDLDRRGETVSDPPPLNVRKVVDNRNDRAVDLPRGIDLGFSHNVGTARLRAFTPPPLGGLPQSFPANVTRPPLPATRSLPGDRLMPDGLSQEDYARAFLDEFGAGIGKPATFTDVVGEDLVISEDLFLDAGGNIKVTRFMRHRFVKVMARTIKDPDEIWWRWEERADKPGAFTLRRRYIARWKLDAADDQASGVSVFEWSRDGWRGVTSFAPAAGRTAAQDRYLEGQRSGMLAYRRKE
ncbi:MAG: PBECR2 nuclease fold domain-containing protein [Rhodospirillales bacterium]